MATPTEIAYNRAALIESLQFTFVMDEVGKHLSEVICGFGIVLNLLLIYVIFKRTPKHMRSYAVLLFNFAIFDLLTCVASLLACQKTIFSGLSLTYIFHGPCKYVSSSLCFFCHCFVCHAMAHSQWILLISFIYRYRVLVDGAPDTKKMIVIVSLFYAMSAVIFLFYFWDIGDTNDLKQIMYDLHPQYHYDDREIWGDIVVSGNTTVLTIPSLIAIFYMTMPCVPIYFIIHYFRDKTLSTLASNALSMSPATKASHQKLIMALSIQAAIPIFWLVASGIFTLAEFGIIDGPIPENITFRLMDCIPSSSPLVAFIFIAPYREGLLRIISKTGIYRKQENRVSSVVEKFNQPPKQPTNPAQQSANNDAAKTEKV
ncbi:Serpentine receptor class delta-1 [Caenorhabditis elegans]|uniref:Serpentine receptor class delta-1 n=1 Tax=Caenorhabditis elegans TaxID=6239 RepID=SRD1_CAEEL|nr:Serpentine receptor class delta-1 [Caenorhabditis elegans]Q19992.1 RecName: Full=Serpentine receptor class delta-1; Short=Protein srd-1 [Caenorhabditis elegans]CAA88700.1 Serpentine receptor class delta-1 [Caenorhabditis elegans]|eukprot:NP_496195.1 Serpentine receptor class delta-1 [Caenorhabditis elegans]